MVQRMLLDVMAEDLRRNRPLQPPPQPEEFFDVELLQPTPNSPPPTISQEEQGRGPSPSVLQRVRDWHIPERPAPVDENQMDEGAAPVEETQMDEGGQQNERERSHSPFHGSDADSDSTVDFNHLREAFIRANEDDDDNDSVIIISDDESENGEHEMRNNIAAILAFGLNNADVPRMGREPNPNLQQPPPPVEAVEEAGENVEAMEQGVRAEEVVDNVGAEVIVDAVAAEEVVEAMEVEHSCPVCYDELLSKSPWIFKCRHLFCGECATRILRTTKVCPLCRTRAVSRFTGPIYFG